MSDNYKWFDNDIDKTLSYVVVLMISRNKDNNGVKNFKERRSAYLTTYDMQKIYRRFNHFVEDGVKDEFSRLYMTFNSRNVTKIKKELLHLLIDKDEIPYEHIQGLIAGIAARKECAAEHKWMFDFDSESETLLKEFLEEIPVKYEAYQTPNGYAIIVEHGFDIRALMKNWNSIVTLKRDDLRCIYWRKKIEI